VTTLPIAVPAAELSRSTVRDLVRHLRAALDGTGPAVVPVAAPADDGGVPAVPTDVALGIRTSGSTGTPRTVLLGRDALRASATATHERLGGPGRWLLSLPVVHVAGVQVLVRSLLAGTDPVLLGGRFDAAAWAAAAAAARTGPERLYGSLVPTQLHRVVAAARADAAVRDDVARARLDAVLLGGAAAPAGLLADAAELGLRVVRTYGMSETAGGCVYDGVPLDGVRVRLVDGVVEIAGPVLSHGYLVRDDARDGGGGDRALDTSAFRLDDGERWFVTQDLGETDDDGRLRVLGRRDDMIVTGGVNVAPAAVESVLSTLVTGGVGVVGVPDDEWGRAVVAVLTPAAGDVDLAALREHVRRSLGAAAAPRHVVVVDRLPEKGPGKVDRVALERHAATVLGRGRGR